MVFVIHWHESAMDLQVFPIPITTPTSLSTRFLWVFPVHQAIFFSPCFSLSSGSKKRNKGSWKVGGISSPVNPAMPLPPPPSSLHPLSPPQIITTVTKVAPMYWVLECTRYCSKHFPCATHLVPQAYKVGTHANPCFIDEEPKAHRGTVIVPGLCTSESRILRGKIKSIGFDWMDNA